MLDDFKDALKKLGPSVNPTQRRKYYAMRNKFAGVSLRLKDQDAEVNGDEERVPPAANPEIR